MTSTLESRPLPLPDVRWLWAVRVAALAASLLDVWRLTYGLLHQHEIGPLFRAHVAAESLTLVAYVGILWLLLAGKHTKWGLALAVSWGTATLLSSFWPFWLVLYSEIFNYFSRTLRVYYGYTFTGPALRFLKLFALTQSALVATGIGTYYKMGREFGDTRILLRSVIIAVLYLAFLQFTVRALMSAAR